MDTLDRERGTLLGLAVGDALGAAVEFQMPGTFDEVTGYRGGGPHGLGPGEWTDDSSMALALIIDQWNPGQKRYRFETFCYGPKSCSLYRAGPTRKVPGRKGMSWEEEDWVDEDATAHRGLDE